MQFCKKKKMQFKMKFFFIFTTLQNTLKNIYFETKIILIYSI